MSGSRRRIAGDEMECSHCGADNTAAATFCNLCFNPLVGPAETTSPAVDEENQAVLPGMDEITRQRMEEAEMWRQRRRRAAEEAALAQEAGEVPKPVFDQDIEVMQSVAVANHSRRMVSGIAIGAAVFVGISILGVAILATADYGALIKPAQTALEAKAIAQTYVTPLYWRFIEAATLYLIGAATAAGITANRVGRFAPGMWVVLVPTILQAAILLPVLYIGGQKSPVVSMLGFGVAFLVASPVAGAIAGAAAGTRLKLGPA